MTVEEQVKLICRDNQYLLHEIEVKKIIECWKKDRDSLIKAKEILNSILK